MPLTRATGCLGLGLDPDWARLRPYPYPDPDPDPDPNPNPNTNTNTNTKAGGSPSHAAFDPFDPCDVGPYASFDACVDKATTDGMLCDTRHNAGAERVRRVCVPNPGPNPNSSPNPDQVRRVYAL